MNIEEQEHLLTEYFLGNLDWEQSEKVESMLKNSPEIRRKWQLIQEGIEHDVSLLERPEVDSGIIKGRIFDQLGLKHSELKSLKGNVVKPGFPAWILGSGWAVAAAVVLISLISVMNQGYNPVIDSPQNGIALAVFDLENSGNRSSASVKNVVYRNDLENDTLFQAEMMAEHLWNQYMESYRRKSKETPGQGFVVYDVEGKQGFVGVYHQNLVDKKSDDHQEIYLSFSSGDEAIPVGAIRPDEDEIEGVFYFSLDKELDDESMIDPVMPVLARRTISGI